MKIGDPIWIHQYSYSRSERERWVKHIIIGETTRSWLVVHEHRAAAMPPEQLATYLDPKDYHHRFVIKIAKKINKDIKSIKSITWVGVCYSESEVDDRVWLNEHRSHIARQVETVQNIACLRQIAALIEYNEATHGSGKHI